MQNQTRHACLMARPRKKGYAVTAVERAAESFEQGLNCAQAVLVTYGPARGLPAEVASRIGAPLGSGLGRLGRTCGAVAGGIILIGLMYTEDAARSPEGRQQAYDVVAEFVEAFRARNGSISCRDLLGCDLSQEAGRKQALDEGLYRKVCPKLVRDAAELFEQLAPCTKGPQDDKTTAGG
jgi:C_GCAxxG_C_C family probable redox protein